MKICKLLNSLLLIMLLVVVSVHTSCQLSSDSEGSVAIWYFSDLHDNAGKDSKLETFGNVQLVALEGEASKESQQRGGKGMAARFNGGWFNAGQGADGELNISGKSLSIYVRAQVNSIDGFSPLLTKAGNDQNIAYSIAFNKIKDDIYIEAMIGSDDIAGAHLLKHKLHQDQVNKWHDIIFRFDGKTSELYIDGILRDDEVTVGDIRDWNHRPVLIGAQLKQPYGYVEITDEQVEYKFDGLISCVGLWNHYLTEKEVCKLSAVKELTDGKPEYYNEKYRSQVRFSAQKNWLNDPNGLVYYDGVYHMFFQYMPPHRPGAYKDWGHAVSKDLVHWEQTTDHITPHKVWSGCWSGSAVVDVNNTSGFRSGKEAPVVAFITNGGNPQRGIGSQCTQCIAYSNDGGKTFTYYDQNPIMYHISNENRDPKVVWDEESQQWIMSLFMDVGYDFGIFASSDLKEWKHLSTVAIEGVRECPGFEPLAVDGDKSNKKWMFLGANGDYVIGSFDGKIFKPETKVLRGDYGVNFYAAQTWSNAPNDRCVLVAWMPTQRYPDMPFEQHMNFPTQVTLHTTKQGLKAFRMPIDEIKSLYNKKHIWDNKKVVVGENIFKDLDEELYDMDLEIDVANRVSFQLKLRDVVLTYDATKETISCGGPSVGNGIIPSDWVSKNPAEINETNNLGKAPLSPIDGKIKLRILLDRTTVEVFGNDGEITITSCFMPQSDKNTFDLISSKDLTIVKAEVHSLESIWKKRD